MSRKGRRGLSTVIGTIFFIVLTIIPASILFATVARYNDAARESLKIEEERNQESILLHKLETDYFGDVEYIANITLNNTGSIASRIRAVYIDDEFKFDPSESQNTYLDPKKSLTITFPLFPKLILYEKNLKISVATERGIKSSEYAYILKGDYVTSGYKFRPYYGPLQLNFTDFKYTECDPNTGYYDDSSWKDGWRLVVGPQTVVWRINVTNIDDRDITLTQFSCFTLSPNDQPSDRRVWYIDFPIGLNKTIKAGEWSHLIYKWSTPKDFNPNTQSIYSTTCRAKVFLTFFGYFHEKDGRTKTYGQTIPFEAVIIVGTLENLDVFASPINVPADGVSVSTISATLLDGNGDPVNGANITFTTDLGELSSSWARTVDGKAKVNLTSSITGLAKVTATYLTFIDSIVVEFKTVITVSTDKPTYLQNDIVVINGIRMAESPKLINISIIHPNATMIYNNLVYTGLNGLFTANCQLVDADSGTYLVKARDEYGWEATTSFEVCW